MKPSSSNAMLYLFFVKATMVSIFFQALLVVCFWKDDLKKCGVSINVFQLGYCVLMLLWCGLQVGLGKDFVSMMEGVSKQRSYQRKRVDALLSLCLIVVYMTMWPWAIAGTLWFLKASDCWPKYVMVQAIIDLTISYFILIPGGCIFLPLLVMNLRDLQASARTVIPQNEEKASAMMSKDAGTLGNAV